MREDHGLDDWGRGGGGGGGVTGGRSCRSVLSQAYRPTRGPPGDDHWGGHDGTGGEGGGRGGGRNSGIEKERPGDTGMNSLGT